MCPKSLICVKIVEEFLSLTYVANSGTRPEAFLPLTYIDTYISYVQRELTRSRLESFDEIK